MRKRNFIIANVLPGAALLLMLIFSSLPFTGRGQDVHFSQYAYAPLQINPAFTGVFDGTARISNIYRSQWSGLGKGYKTLHFSVDAPVGKAAIRNGFFGVGLMVFQDKAGQAGFKSTIIDGSLSYTTALDDQKESYLTIGFQAGLNQNAIDLSAATWDSQWNGDAFDPRLSSMEKIQLQQATYIDLNAGLLYYYVPDESNSFNVGASLSHIGGPNVSFYTENLTPLKERITVHSSSEISVNKDNLVWVVPRALFMFQGPQKEIVFGGSIKNKIQFKSRYTNYKKEAYVYGGALYRWDDALVLNARFEFNTLGLGLSYDINTSELSSLSSGANAFEVNFSFVSYIQRGNRTKNYNKMPRFF